ncbi:glycosyltransferase [bacterium]|nr:MAG: glycosyltransferase [bacterium]
MQNKLRIALVVPHIFMQNGFEETLIFAPGKLAIDLARNLSKLGVEVHFFTPDLQIPEVENYNVDLNKFYEIASEKTNNHFNPSDSFPKGAINQNDILDYSQKQKLELLQEFLKKHPLTCITLSRQVLTELISKAYELGNFGEFDLIHFFTAEEEIAPAFAKLSKVPVCFTHHEPFDFLAKYKSQFEKYKDLNWISISNSQQKSLPQGNFIANVYNGFDNEFDFENQRQNLPSSHLVQSHLPIGKDNKDIDLLYIGRIIKPKGVSLAVKLAEKYNLKLKIVGKYYSGFGNDNYFEEEIKPFLSQDIEYLGYISGLKTKSELMARSKCLIMPSIWEEPFGMVMIEAMSVGTPVLGLDSGSIPEVIKNDVSGIVVEKKMSDPFHMDEIGIVDWLYDGFQKVVKLDSEKVYEHYKQNFTVEKMAKGYLEVYERLLD